MAGTDALYEGAFRQFGLVRVGGIGELSDTLRAFDSLPLPAGNRVFVYTQAGGPGIFCVDEMAGTGLFAPAMIGAASREALRRALPPIASICKPEGHADITAAALADHHVNGLEVVLRDPGVDAVLFITVATLFLDLEDMARRMLELLARLKGEGIDKPVLPVILSGNWVRPARAVLERGGLPTYDSPDGAVRVLAALTRYAQFRRRGRAGEEPPMRLLDELEAFAFLGARGVPVVRHELAATLEQAVAAARGLGWPVALKLSSQRLAHKTEAGGVRLGIRGEAELEEAWASLCAAAAALGLRPGEGLRGLLVEEMVRGGAEFIIGGLRDEAFGPAVMFGLGGVLTELVGDASFRLAPVDSAEARRMIGETRAPRLLAGFRGGPPLPQEPLVEAIVRASEVLAVDERIVELDLNPFLLAPDGGRAADALLRLRD